jgi:hypothetical protein
MSSGISRIHAGVLLDLFFDIEEGSEMLRETSEILSSGTSLGVLLASGFHAGVLLDL